jgi:hypothetical protein
MFTHLVHAQQHIIFLPFTMPPKRLALSKNALSNVFALSKPSSRTFEMDHFSGHILPPFQNKTYVLENPLA